MMQNKQQIDLAQLTEEMIRFLQKWGLWRDVSILTMGNRYRYCKEGEKKFRNLPHVEVTKDVDPEEAMQQITGAKCDGKLVWKSLANPEHIYDMIFEGALCTLLSYDCYEVRKSDLSDEGWAYIFENTSILEDYLDEKYGCSNLFEFWQLTCEEKFENPDYSAWDPLVFDTWEEFQEFIGYEEPGLYENYKRFDTYEKYLNEMQLAEANAYEMAESVWDQMVADAKQELMRDYGIHGDKMISPDEMYSDVREEFNQIFERHGLWYEMCFRNSLTCYRNGEY